MATDPDIVPVAAGIYTSCISFESARKGTCPFYYRIVGNNIALIRTYIPTTLENSTMEDHIAFADGLKGNADG